jgi:hypothetical protein
MLNKVNVIALSLQNATHLEFVHGLYFQRVDKML